MTRRLVPIFLLLISIPLPVAAADLEDAIARLRRGDYTEALMGFRKMADQGDTEAQYYLGSAYNLGVGGPKDYAEVAKWYRKAADQGHAGGQLNLGVLYADGDRVPQDYTMSIA